MSISKTTRFWMKSWTTKTKNAQFNKTTFTQQVFGQELQETIKIIIFITTKTKYFYIINV